MPSFRYRLEGLLRLRQHQEDEARLKLADAQRICLQVEHELADLADERESASQDLAPAGGVSSLTALKVGYARISHLDAAEVTVRQRLEAASCLHDQHREDVVGAHRARRTLEHLHERQLERHQRERRRQEMLETDEVGTQIAVRRMVQEGSEHKDG